MAEWLYALCNVSTAANPLASSGQNLLGPAMV